MAEDSDLEFQAWFQDAIRKVQGGQQALEEEAQDAEAVDEEGEE